MSQLSSPSFTKEGGYGDRQIMTLLLDNPAPMSMLSAKPTAARSRRLLLLATSKIVMLLSEKGADINALAIPATNVLDLNTHRYSS